MTENVLGRLFEHNNWANEQIIRACLALPAEVLDAEPHSATRGTIRRTLTHLVGSQHGYLSLLTLPLEQRVRIDPGSDELLDVARTSGEGLLALAQAAPNSDSEARRQTRDGYWVEPWVVMLQAINHATEHREQIKSMLSALGVTPPEVDGWTYGEVTHALVPIAQG